jgi:DinB superfamily
MKADLPALIDELEETPAFVLEALALAPETSWDTRPPGMEFSLREQVCHLRDIELEGYLVRIHRIAAEVAPLLVDLDGSRLARERDYASQDARLAAADFRALRLANVAKLRALPSTAWERTGRFAPDACFSLRELLDMMLAHDREHCGEIGALCART